MLTLKFIQENKEEVITRLKVKNFDASAIIEKIIALNNERREVLTKAETSQAEMNSLSKEIGALYKAGKTEEANSAKAKTAELKNTIKEFNTELDKIKESLHAELVQLPNLPHSSVPAGKSADDNKVVKVGGSVPSLDPSAVPHWDLIKKYDLIDFDLGIKITGAGFPVYKGKGAKLQRALINFFLDEAEKAGFNEVLPPLLVNEDSGFGTGQLPDKEGQMYHATADNLYLIPTAEVPVTNLYRNVILKASDFPVRNCAYSACFRREAGSWGKDVRGLNRLHQFDKVEIVQITHPEKSYKALDGMVDHVQTLVEKLELPFRILRLCGGDMSFTSALTYDFALALPRIVAALLENNQTPEGIKIPKVLVPYTGFDIIK